jgi:hypothetical protein
MKKTLYKCLVKSVYSLYCMVLRITTNNPGRAFGTQIKPDKRFPYLIRAHPEGFEKTGFQPSLE